MWLYVAILLATLAAYLFSLRNKRKQEEKEEGLIAELIKPKCWTDDENCENNSIKEFKIATPKEDIDSLKKRLKATKWSLPSLSTTKFTYGFRDDVLKKIVSYWADEYDWSKRSEMINSLGNFKTKIEGLNIQFLHSKSKTNTFKSTPILMIHGWPGSVVEFCKVIPMLTDPTANGGNESDVFDVVCPSIPGYGFSDAPQKEGFNAYECARIFHTLMLRLGYDKYIVQGGDWGSLIANCIATLYPEHLIGIHTNMATSQSGNGKVFLKQMIGVYFPELLYPRVEARALYPLKKYFTKLLVETGYMHLQATKPDTVGFALSDSPTGLAAYILEKFSSWTMMSARDSDDGMLEQFYSMDELLDNVMLYWLNNNITSSMRFYKENISNHFQLLQDLGQRKIEVLAGYSWFPEEIGFASRAEIAERFPNLLHFTYMERGGHFGALQCPHDIAREMRAFLRKIKQRQSSK